MEQVIDYKGYRIRIVQDNLSESPDSWGDKNLFLTFSHKLFDVRRSGFEPIQIRENINSYKEDYWIFTISAYIHSGIHLSLINTVNYPDKNWDVSTSGYILASKKEFNGYDDAKSSVLSLIQQWNDYLSGDVYGFIIEKEAKYYKFPVKDVENGATFKDIIIHSEIITDHKEVDSCYGFYGNSEESGLLTEAKLIIDNLIKNE